MSTKGQTVEEFLFEQLNRIAPGKYTLASVLDRFKAQLRFGCTHLKGGGRRNSLQGPGKDYNLSIFTFSTGVTEIKCLYNCGLKIRSDQPDMERAFSDLYDLPTTNTPAKSEEMIYTKGGERIPIDPGPVPVYTDADRRRIRESTETFWKNLETVAERGLISLDHSYLGGVVAHPDPVEAPESIVKRQIIELRTKKQVMKALKMPVVLVQDLIPEVKSNTKIRKARKQSRKRG